MTQKALFFYTDGFTGDVNDGAAPYTEAEFRDYNRAVLTGNEADAGVLAGVDNELAVSGATSPLAVATGRAQVYGFHYFNDASVAPTVTTPAVGDTGGRVVIRCNLTAANNPPLENQARVLVILNTDGNAAIPAMTQVANTTWDIPLGTFVVDTSGDIWTDASKSVAGVTDARIFAISPLAGMVKLREFVGDGSTGTCTFDNIQQNLNHLLIVGMLRSDNASVTDTILAQFNGDTGLNYGDSSIAVQNSTTSVTQSALGANDSMRIGLVTAATGEANGDPIKIDIPHYRSSLPKSLTARVASAGNGTVGGSGVRSEIMDGWWETADPITRVDIFLTLGNFPDGTRLTLYGMR